MAYQPRNVPSDPAALPEYLRAELNRLAQELRSTQELLRLSPTNATPVRPRNGDIRLADGVNWAPGESGVYRFDGTTWQPLTLYSNNRTVTPDAGALTLTGYAPSVTVT